MTAKCTCSRPSCTEYATTPAEPSCARPGPAESGLPSKDGSSARNAAVLDVSITCRQRHDRYRRNLAETHLQDIFVITFVSALIYIRSNVGTYRKR